MGPTQPASLSIWSTRWRILRKMNSRAGGHSSGVVGAPEDTILMRRNGPIENFQLLRIAGAVLAFALWSTCSAAQNQTGTATIEFAHPRYVIRPTAQIAQITLRRTGNTNSAVSVDFATQDETAVAGTNYADKTGPINFAAGQTQQIVVIPVLAGPRKDENKIVRLVLSNPTGGVVLGRSTAELVLPRLRSAA